MLSIPLPSCRRIEKKKRANFALDTVQPAKNQATPACCLRAPNLLHDLRRSSAVLHRKKRNPSLNIQTTPGINPTTLGTERKQGYVVRGYVIVDCENTCPVGRPSYINFIGESVLAVEQYLEPS